MPIFYVEMRRSDAPGMYGGLVIAENAHQALDLIREDASEHLPEAGLCKEFVHQVTRAQSGEILKLIHRKVWAGWSSSVMVRDAVSPD